MPWSLNTPAIPDGQAPFTEARAQKLDNLTDRFKGVYANSTERDASVTTPAQGDYVKQNDTGTIWFYGDDGWIDSNDTSTGNMVDAVYDPQGIADDVFDRANHTGKIGLSDIESDITSIRISLMSGAQSGDLYSDEHVSLTSVVDATDNTASLVLSARGTRWTLPQAIITGSHSGTSIDPPYGNRLVDNASSLGGLRLCEFDGDDLGFSSPTSWFDNFGVHLDIAIANRDTDNQGGSEDVIATYKLVVWAVSHDNGGARHINASMWCTYRS